MCIRHDVSIALYILNSIDLEQFWKKLIKHVRLKDFPGTTCSASTEVEEQEEENKTQAREKAKEIDVLAFLIVLFEASLHIWILGYIWHIWHRT